MNRQQRRKWYRAAVREFVQDGGSHQDASRVAEAMLSVSAQRGVITEDAVIEELRRRGQLAEGTAA